MKKNYALAALLIVISTSFWAACSKSSSSSSTNPSITLMTQATWKYDTSGIDLNRDGVIDVADTTIPACFKDNTFTFYKDSTGIMNEGATTCQPGAPQIDSFTWSISGSNPQVLTTNADSLLAGGIKIFALTSTKLELYKDTSIVGVNFWYIYSLKH